jgi:hypothetical protein
MLLKLVLYERGVWPPTVNAINTELRVSHQDNRRKRIKTLLLFEEGRSTVGAVLVKVGKSTI